MSRYRTEIFWKSTSERNHRIGNPMSSMIRLRLPTRLALSCLCLATAELVGAQPAPIGTYHLRSTSLELTTTGQARFSNSFGTRSVASYVLAGDTITLRDQDGPAACPGSTGRYLWRADTDALRFQLI